MPKESKSARIFGAHFHCPRFLIVYIRRSASEADIEFLKQAAANRRVATTGHLLALHRASVEVIRQGKDWLELNEQTRKH